MTQLARAAGALACAALLLAVTPALAASPPAHAGKTTPAQARAEDFDVLWRAIDTGYAYFDARRSEWSKVRAKWRPRAVHAGTSRELLAALEGAVDALDDQHVTLSQRTPEARRRIPSETDIWARWKDGAAVVDAVRAFGDADVAGLKPGDAVTRVQGRDVAEAVREQAGEGASPAERDRALRSLLAGPRIGGLRLEVRDARGTRSLVVERAAAPPPHGPAVTALRMGEARDLGYVRLRAAQPAERVVRELDRALALLADTRGMILDLRQSPGPPTRAATRAILARFAPAGTPWQIRVARSGARVTDLVPEGTLRYGAPLVVLVDRWTEGEAEALGAGLREAAHARLLGTPTAGLHGDLRAVTLPHSRIVLRFPAERTLLLDGSPREPLRPDVAVDLAAPSGGPGDPILYQGLKAFDAAPAAPR